MVTGSHYLGGFIGDGDYNAAWLGEKVWIWKEAIDMFVGVA